MCGASDTKEERKKARKKERMKERKKEKIVARAVPVAPMLVYVRCEGERGSSPNGADDLA